MIISQCHGFICGWSVLPSPCRDSVGRSVIRFRQSSDHTFIHPYSTAVQLSSDQRRYPSPRLTRTRPKRLKRQRQRQRQQQKLSYRTGAQRLLSAQQQLEKQHCHAAQGAICHHAMPWSSVSSVGAVLRPDPGPTMSLSLFPYPIHALVSVLFLPLSKCQFLDFGLRPKGCQFFFPVPYSIIAFSWRRRWHCTRGEVG